ncbi:protein O-mannosyl-transferase TMTC1 isoform X2 [Takifugu flavidus]|uniref:dolichyl-phosphate-mannose--protein mannosyltransferase n=1 Tax=Takifugu flavidus TaxID=433684 RepID=A0A5C6P452_9TELE|nr:protein O-mannosyl-transferase TMTC1 isoform X2 [Takifugu flavidus]TWW73551.1 Transmembrane and TPR repeat-containing protein 1 [Takifugu flavidus]
MTAHMVKKQSHQPLHVNGRPRAMYRAGRYVVLASLCALCYSNSVHGELVHDDVWAIVNNPDVRADSSLRKIFSDDFWGKPMSDNTSHKSYRPLCILTFKLNVLLHGMNPFYFHVTNLLLHCAVTCLLMYTCECCVFEDGLLAFVTALIFAVHPIHTEAVTGVVGRADVLACMLFLLAFLSYIRSVGVCLSEDDFPPTVSVGCLLISVLLGTCAMLVKETGITVFGVCIIYDALVLCRKPLAYHMLGSRFSDFLHISSPFTKRACFISVCVLIILSVRLWLMGGSMPLFSEQDNPASFSPYLLTRILTYSYLLSFNAWLLLVPVVLCYDWQVGSIPLVESLGDLRNGATVLLALVIITLCIRCLFSLKESREILVGVLFLVFPFIPASNLFFRVGFVVAERVLYMPSMGYCILVALGVSRLCTVVGRYGTTVVSVSVVLLLLSFSWKTVHQNQVWLSREALFRSGIRTLPHNAKVHYNYANFLKDSGQLQEAIQHYSTALRLYPQHASAMNNLGTLTQSPEEAESYYRKALVINPQHNRALFNLGNLFKSQGKEKEAESLLRNSIHFGPYFADAYSSLASLYAEQKRFAEAKEIYLKGIGRCPENSDLHNNYGVFLVDTGEDEMAVDHYQQAIRLKPTHYIAMVNLGRLLRLNNKNQDAEFWYKRALQVTKNVDILTPLGALYYNTGRYEEALQVYREATTLQPDNTDIWLAFAQVLAVADHTNEAEKLTLEIISKEISCIECYRLLSAIYSKRGNYTEALGALDRALQQNLGDLTVRAELYFSKGNQLRELNLLDQAFKSYKLAVELKPDQSQAWMNMGGIQHIKGDYAAARMYYQRALLLNPSSKLLKENLAKLDRLERRLSAGEK